MLRADVSLPQIHHLSARNAIIFLPPGGHLRRQRRSLPSLQCTRPTIVQPGAHSATQPLETLSENSPENFLGALMIWKYVVCWICVIFISYITSVLMSAANTFSTPKSPSARHAVSAS